MQPGTLRLLRAIEVLDRIDTNEARGELTVLAQGADGAYVTQEANASLTRLNRASHDGK